MKKFLLVLVVAAALVVGGFYLIVGDPVVFYNNQKMDYAMLHQKNGKMTFDEITNFEWDAMYSFKHTMSKAEIEGVLGFESKSIKEPSSDTFIQVVFVKDGKVVCNLNGVYTALGYNVIFQDTTLEYHKILNSDKIEFEVKDIENVIRFTEVDKGIVVPPDKQMGIY